MGLGMSELELKPMEVFMPGYCVQGERIPFYLLWDKSKSVTISVTLPDGLKFKELYNIDLNDLKTHDRSIVVNKFETEGYFGGVIESKLYHDASSVKTVKFSIEDDQSNIQSYDKSIELFRPDIQVSDNTKIITIKTDKNNKLISNERISVYNQGRGTGIIRINILDESEIKEGYPEGFEEFRTQFLEDLNLSFDNMERKFPQYAEIIKSIKVIALDPLPSDGEKLKKVHSTMEKLEDAFSNNEEFLFEFVRSVASAYLKNVSLMTDIDAFLAFMKSIGKNKIILIDAMKVLKVSTIPKKFSAELIITDLVQNVYSPIKLPTITISADRECAVPVYQILAPSLK